MLISFARSDRKLPHTSTKTSDGDDMISGSVGGVQYDLLAFSSSVASIAF